MHGFVCLFNWDGALLASMYVQHVWCLQSQKKASVHMELDLLMVVSQHVATGS